jgi:hypothetical protein
MKNHINLVYKAIKMPQKSPFYDPRYFDEIPSNDGITKREILIFVGLLVGTFLSMGITGAVTHKILSNNRLIADLEAKRIIEQNLLPVRPIDCKCEIKFCPCDKALEDCPPHPLLPNNPTIDDNAALSKCYLGCNEVNPCPSVARQPGIKTDTDASDETTAVVTEIVTTVNSTMAVVNTTITTVINRQATSSSTLTYDRKTTAKKATISRVKSSVNITVTQISTTVTKSLSSTSTKKELTVTTIKTTVTTEANNKTTSKTETEVGDPIITIVDNIIDDVKKYVDDKVVTIQKFLTQPNDMSWATKFRRFITALDYFVTPFLRIYTRRSTEAKLHVCSICSNEAIDEYLKCVMSNNKLKMNDGDHLIYNRTDAYWQNNQMDSFGQRSREESQGFPLVSEEGGRRTVKMPKRDELWQTRIDTSLDGLNYRHYETFYETLLAFSLNTEGGGKCRLCPELWESKNKLNKFTFWKSHALCLKYGSRFHDQRPDLEALKREGFTWRLGALYFEDKFVFK